MPDVIGIGLRVAGFDDLVANLEQRFLNLRHALAGFDVYVHGSGAELGPEFGIRDETARLFMRESRPFGDAAKRVIHCPVQARVERRHLLTGTLKLMCRCILRRAHGDFDEEIALDGVPAFEVNLRLSERKSPRQVDQTGGSPRPEAEAVLAIIRIELPMGAYPALRTGPLIR